MELELLLTFVAATIVWGTWKHLIRAVVAPSPGGSVLLTSSLYLTGAVVLLWRDGSPASQLIAIICSALLTTYLLAYFGISRLLRLKQQTQGARSIRYVRDSQWFTVFKWSFLVIMLGVVITGVAATGAIKLLWAFYNFVAFGDTSSSILELRTAFVAGENGWLAPGYLKQLRDVLLPFATLLVLFTIKRKAQVFLILAVFLLPVVCVLMLSTGERGPALLFVIAVVHTSIRAMKWGFIARSSALLPLAVLTFIALGAFSSLTASFTSRDYENQSDVSILLDRIVIRVPEENMQGVEVWSQRAPFPGAGWFSEIASVMPGTQVTLSGIIHEYIGGGTGNSVLGMWIDVFYNFGWIAGGLVAILLGVLMALFNHWVNAKRRLSNAGDVCGIWIAVTMYMVLSPFGFLLYGPFLLSACLWVICWTKSSKQVDTQDALRNRIPILPNGRMA